jgi:site-specific recombinase
LKRGKNFVWIYLSQIIASYFDYQMNLSKFRPKINFRELRWLLQRQNRMPLCIWIKMGVWILRSRLTSSHSYEYFKKI